MELHEMVLNALRFIYEALPGSEADAECVRLCGIMVPMCPTEGFGSEDEAKTFVLGMLLNVSATNTWTTDTAPIMESIASVEIQRMIDLAPDDDFETFLAYGASKGWLIEPIQ